MRASQSRTATHSDGHSGASGDRADRRSQFWSQSSPLPGSSSVRRDRLNFVKGDVANRRTGVRHQRLDRVRDRRQGIACANDLAPQTRGIDPVARVGERGPNGSAKSVGRGRPGAQVDAGP